MNLIVLPNPSFLTPREAWLTYRKNHRRLLMADFYVEQRRRLNILVENNNPIGGQWSFDEDNRKSIPKSLVPPTTPRFPPDRTTQEVIKIVTELFPNHPGNAEEFDWPSPGHKPSKNSTPSLNFDFITLDRMKMQSTIKTTRSGTASLVHSSIVASSSPPKSLTESSNPTPPLPAKKGLSAN
ncbi:hypothetical protein CCB80_00065 [Armatimonadetes bacterium Uphvl-Ar1]|nr:hypothetical protein CCB80_00065 [Armatimonadetes bacterium Uphvl-Ar1]